MWSGIGEGLKIKRNYYQEKAVYFLNIKKTKICIYKTSTFLCKTLNIVEKKYLKYKQIYKVLNPAPNAMKNRIVYDENIKLWQ